MFKYAKYTLFHLLTIPFAIGLTLGGDWMYLGLAAAAGFVILGDLLFGDDTVEPVYGHEWILNLQLYSSLVLIFAMNFLMVWTVADIDVLGYGAFVQQLTGYDAAAGRADNTLLQYAVAILSCGLLSSVVGTIVGHELTHRTWDPVAMFIGRWLLAFSWDTGFSIEHVYGHHIYVSTVGDPATAPRGRNVYFHILASTWKGNISAWKLEKQRLQKKRLPVFSHHNLYIRGLLMSLLLEIAAFAMAGWIGVLVFTASALIAKAFLEIVNFMEHYGMVRNPKTPVQPYHSWNTNKRVSSWATFNLTRHSHHHAEGDVPFHKLRSYQDAPMMVNGYLTTIFLTLIPPLWNRIMVPKVLDWDRRYATAEELELAMEANKRSGIKEFMQQDYRELIAAKKSGFEKTAKAA